MKVIEGSISQIPKQAIVGSFIVDEGHCNYTITTYLMITHLADNGVNECSAILMNVANLWFLK